MNSFNSKFYIAEEKISKLEINQKKIPKINDRKLKGRAYTKESVRYIVYTVPNHFNCIYRGERIGKGQFLES